ncbi:MAG: PIG-L family deacetylase, partial [Chloroflexi bacterium]|nr:PIG-L family deacetylase [Chloroflexota bacterium]
MTNPGQRRILCVFAHPDDETTTTGASIIRSIREGVQVHVVTATRGEQGTLGTGGVTYTREELPQVREAELRSVMQLFGVEPPLLFDYKDHLRKDADVEEVAGKVLAVMQEVRPDVVVTFGPNGISYHDDHIAIHKAAVDAFHRYRQTADDEPRLLYVALSKVDAERYDLKVEGVEGEPNVFIRATPEEWALKLQAMRMYRF